MEELLVWWRAAVVGALGQHPKLLKRNPKQQQSPPPTLDLPQAPCYRLASKLLH